MAFNQADVLIITEIFSAGEQPIPGVSGEILCNEIRKFGHKHIHFEPDMKNIPSLIKELVKPKDMVLIMGAGSISSIIPEIIAALGETH